MPDFIHNILAALLVFLTLYGLLVGLLALVRPWLAGL